MTETPDVFQSPKPIIIALVTALALAACKAPEVPQTGVPAAPTQEREAPTTPTPPQPPRVDLPSPPADPIVAIPEGQPPEGGWPVVAMLHGYNSNQRDFGPVAELAATKGLAAVSLPGLIDNGSMRFQWKRGDAELTHAYVQATVAQSLKGKDVALDRIWLAGFSQGALHSSILVLTHPESYRGALAIAPAGWTELPKAATVGAPRAVTVFTGRGEIPRYRAKTDEVAAMLKREGMLADLIEHRGGHNFPPGWRPKFEEIFASWTKN